jgi:hypothetical protein
MGTSDLKVCSKCFATIMEHHGTPNAAVPPSIAVSPPVHFVSGAARDSLLQHARDDFIIARPSQLHASSGLSEADPHKSVLRLVGPVAVARRAKQPSRIGGAFGDTRSLIRLIGLALALICVAAALAASVPLLLSLLGP